MTREELLRALRRLAPETGSLCCLGCGYEHNCSTHGCAVIRAAVEALKEPPNAPLTLEQLREMDGEPVWIRNHRTGDYICRVILLSDENFIYFTDADLCENWSYGSHWTAYRRKPEEGTV